MTFIPSLTFTRIISGFHGAFATGVASQQGNAYPSGHLVPSPILGLANAPIVETLFLELAMSLLDFLPRIPLGTFSILLYTNILTVISGSSMSTMPLTMTIRFHYHLSTPYLIILPYLMT